MEPRAGAALARRAAGVTGPAAQSWAAGDSRRRRVKPLTPPSIRHSPPPRYVASVIMAPRPAAPRWRAGQDRADTDGGTRADRCLCVAGRSLGGATWRSSIQEWHFRRVGRGVVGGGCLESLWSQWLLLCRFTPDSECESDTCNCMYVSRCSVNVLGAEVLAQCTVGPV